MERNNVWSDIIRQKRKEMKLNDKICLTKNCTTESHTRGLCQSCYASAMIMIKNGELTEDFLIKKGLIKEPIKKTSLFRQQFLG